MRPAARFRRRRYPHVTKWAPSGNGVFNQSVYLHTEETMKPLSAIILSSALAVGIPTAQAQTPSTVDGTAQKQPPKTTGAMDNAVGGIATSPDDVRRQTQGLPTAAEEAKGATPTAPKPEITQQSPGTVGAAPGTTPAPKQ